MENPNPVNQSGELDKKVRKPRLSRKKKIILIVGLVVLLLIFFKPCMPCNYWFLSMQDDVCIGLRIDRLSGIDEECYYGTRPYQQRPDGSLWSDCPIGFSSPTPDQCYGIMVRQ